MDVCMQECLSVQCPKEVYVHLKIISLFLAMLLTIQVRQMTCLIIIIMSIRTMIIAVDVPIINYYY